jgi:hypothetical protein
MGKSEGSTRLGYTGFRGGLEHLKIETKLTDEWFPCVMGECEIVTLLLYRDRDTTVVRGHCRHSLGVSDIDTLGLLGFGGGIWIGRHWSEVNIGYLDFLVSR